MPRLAQYIAHYIMIICVRNNMSSRSPVHVNRKSSKYMYIQPRNRKNDIHTGQIHFRSTSFALTTSLDLKWIGSESKWYHLDPLLDRGYFDPLRSTSVTHLVRVRRVLSVLGDRGVF